MPRLLPIEATLDDAFVTQLLRAWEAGDAVLPVDPRLPRPTAEALLADMKVDEATEPGDALVIATSGTTGRPKGVVLTLDAVLAAGRITSAALEVSAATDRWLACLPLAHVGGLGVVTRSLATGTPLTFDEDDHLATLVSIVPTQAGRLDLSRFRAVLIGGGADWVDDRPDSVVHTYGLTESYGGVVYDGRPLAGVEIDVDDDGAIAVRSPTLLRGYRHGSAGVDSAGWLRTGDLGEWRDGRLVVHGRAGDVIVTGGEKVWPDPVEAVLRRLPGVADTAVVGVADPEWGQRVVAVVVPVEPSHPPTLAELREAVKEAMPSWCAPKEIRLTDALPRTALGKIRRDALRASS